MRFNFRKIASVLASTAMIGSTVALAAAAAYPDPFIKGGNADVALVWGSSPSTAYTDLVAVTDLVGSLQAELAKQTATPGTTGTASASGESINLASSSQKLYMNSSINAARTTLTDSELPTVLADGTATDLQGTQYSYTQSMTLGDSAITFGDSNGETSLDPIPMVQIGTGAGDPLYNYTLSLTKTLNVSDTTNVVGNAELKIQGVSYVIGANSDFNTLYLYGSGTAASVNEGETKTVTVGGVDHTIEFKGSTSTTAGTIVIDGVQKSIAKGSSYKFAGDFEVYIKDIFHTTKTGTLSNIDILLGANTLHFESGDNVRQGADDTVIERTKTYLTGTNGAGITKIELQQAAVSSNGDYLAEGDSYTDRVFGGVEVQFGGLTPKVDDTTREMVKVKADQSISAEVTFTTDVSKKEYTLAYANDADRVADGTLTEILLSSSANKTIHVVEGESAFQDELVLINSGDKGRIVRMGSIPSPGANKKVTITDVISGQTWDFTVGWDNFSTINIDGQPYYMKTSAAIDGSANITWGAGSTYGGPGTQTTVYPRIKLSNGGWFTILTAKNLTNTTTYSLPGIDTLSTYETGALPAIVNTSLGNTSSPWKVGNINYTIRVDSPNSTTGWLYGIDSDSSGSGGSMGNVECVFNYSNGPTILIQEEKTVTGDTTSNGNFICIPLTREGTTTVTPAIGTQSIWDKTALTVLDSDTEVSEGVDIFGTWIQRSTTDANMVTLKIPADQMVVDVLVTAKGVTVTPGAGGGSGSVKELGSVSVSDAEVSSVSSKNLIVVGGSCVNKVAATLLGSSSAICGADFTAKTTVQTGEFLVQSFKSPYSDTKVATLVAGYDASDTTNAAKYLMTQKPDTGVGKKYVGKTATTATLVTV